jgi:hypothetical protein
MATFTEYRRLLDGLETCRWDQMRVLADAAEEAGDAVSAAGWRWLAANKRWPMDVNSEMHFPADVGPRWFIVWGWRGSENVRRPTVGTNEHVLPFDVASRLCHIQADSETPADAAQLLALTARIVGEWLAEEEEQGKLT